MFERARAWLADPHIDLGSLTPGQRYTAVIGVLFAIALVAWGVPRGNGSAGPGLVFSPGASSPSSTTTLPLSAGSGLPGALPAPSTGPATTTTVVVTTTTSPPVDTSTPAAGPPPAPPPSPGPPPPPRPHPTTTTTTSTTIPALPVTVP